MEYAITKISSKGQLVIPTNLRKGINKGDTFLLIKKDDQIILKEIKKLADNLKEEFDFAQKVENSWKKYENKEFKGKTKKSFFKELEKW